MVYGVLLLYYDKYAIRAIHEFKLLLDKLDCGYEITLVCNSPGLKIIYLRIVILRLLMVIILCGNFLVGIEVLLETICAITMSSFLLMTLSVIITIGVNTKNLYLRSNSQN